MEQHSKVGVLDKAVAVLAALSAGPLDLAALTERTGLPRATAHRLASALVVHRLAVRDERGFALGPRCAELARPLVGRAGPVLDELSATTGESAQVYVREGLTRRCIAAREREAGLRDTVPLDSVLPLTAGSAAQVLLAWSADGPPDGAAFRAATLATVRRRGWAESVGQRAPGVASVSAPVRDRDGAVVAAISVSGPLERMTRSPGRRHAAAVLAAARSLTG